MAGMDWFRWHHGSVTDPKFALVARKAGASLPDVLAVWAYILESASQSVERGDFGAIDCEALDCLFGFPNTETRTSNILKAMEDRGLTKGNLIQSWDKRQPKREREDNTSAERQAAFRAKQNQVTPSNATVTPSNTKKHLEESRGDKSRENKNTKDSAAIATRFDDFWNAWPKSERKQDKAKCAEKWKSQNLDDLAGQILADIATKKQTQKWQGGFIEAPEVYLNNRRWEDGVTPDEKQSGSIADPDSRASIEAEGIAMGLGAWDESKEQWHVYKAKVRKPTPTFNLSQLADMAQRRAA